MRPSYYDLLHLHIAKTIYCSHDHNFTISIGYYESQFTIRSAFLLVCSYKDYDGVYLSNQSLLDLIRLVPVALMKSKSAFTVVKIYIYCMLGIVSGSHTDNSKRNV